MMVTPMAMFRVKIRTLVSLHIFHNNREKKNTSYRTEQKSIRYKIVVCKQRLEKNVAIGQCALPPTK
jgi:hypothetical protein